MFLSGDARADAPEASTYHQHTARAVPLGTPTPEQLDLIRAKVVDDEILQGNPPFAWRAVVSNDRLDSYFTRMDRSSLRNYAEDAKAGVAFMNSHRTGGFSPAELPLGMSFDARFVNQGVDGAARVEEDFYTLRGLRLTGLSTDDFIAGLRSGIARDVSIGFYGGWYRCSICDRDMFDWDLGCTHFPGLKYAKPNKEGRQEGEPEVAVAWVMDAHQAEASAVYDGATPGCMVMKATRMAEEGLLHRDAADLISVRYRIALPGARRRFAVPDAVRRRVDGGDPVDPEPQDLEQQVEPSEEVIVKEKAGTPPAGNPEQGESQQPQPAPAAEPVPAQPDVAPDLERAAVPQEHRATVTAAVRWMAGELERLRPLADDGITYRTDLVQDALTQGRRARGAAFQEERYRALLNRSTIEEIKQFRDDWREIADAAQPVGRATRDTETDEPPAAKRAAEQRSKPAPIGAYR